MQAACCAQADSRIRPGDVVRVVARGRLVAAGIATVAAAALMNTGCNGSVAAPSVRVPPEGRVARFGNSAQKLHRAGCEGSRVVAILIIY